MIVVVEGISASGKSTWCAAHGGQCVIAEQGRVSGVPDQAVDPAGAAKFWTERNVDRWQAAVAMEKAASIAVCDTDPLKLHYIWCLWRIGAASEQDWRLQWQASRDALAARRIGFADRYLVETISAETARARARADPTRRRRNFDLHVRLQPPLLDWYSALDAALPDRVRFGLPATMPAAASAGPRYDLSRFDHLIASLSRRPESSV